MEGLNRRDLAAGLAALALLALAALLLWHPGKAPAGPKPGRLEIGLQSCDRLPDVNARARCWIDTYKREGP